MPSLISGSRLKQAVIDETFIVGGDASSVENIKYDFHMGTLVLKASIGQPMELAEIPLEKRFVDPGEAVFVLTKERLNLPANIMATLTPKRKLAHDGILMLGGLAVDPLYKGVLLIGLYNFSSTRFPLQAGKKIIGALFYELDDGSIDIDAPIPAEIKDFPDELTKLIANYTPVELNGMNEKISSMSRELVSLRSDFSSDKKWQDTFKDSLEENTKQIKNLIDGLNKEIVLREKEDEKTNNKIEKMQTMFLGLNIAKGLAVALVLVALGALASYFLPKWLGDKPTPVAAPMAQTPLPSPPKRP